jgi:hypothetical protein
MLVGRAAVEAPICVLSRPSEGHQATDFPLQTGNPVRLLGRPVRADSELSAHEPIEMPPVRSRISPHLDLNLALRRSFALIPSGHELLGQLGLIESISIHEETLSHRSFARYKTVNLEWMGQHQLPSALVAKTSSSWCSVKCWTTVCGSRTGGQTMMDQETWESSRLIPVSGIKGSDEQERRGASAGLAVLESVREFNRALLGPCGAPIGNIECFIEVPFALGDRY